MRIAFFSTKPYDRLFFDRHNGSFGFGLDYFETHLGPHIVNAIDRADAVCVFVNDKVNAEVIAGLAARGVRIVALRCAGFNNVDLEAARKHGLRVCRVPAYSPEAVAEHAMAMILALNRKIHKAYNRVREQNFSLNGLLGFNLHGKTVGVVGTGKIGKAFCRIAAGFGMRILAFDPYPDEELKRQGIAYTSFDDLLMESDIISLHCPLTPENHHLINRQSIQKMKPGVMVVNTSRGGLISAGDIILALKKKKVGYLAIDVYEQEEHLFFRDLSEKIIEDDDIQRLMSFPNVLITAHQAFFTEEAMTQIAQTTLQNIRDLGDGLEPADRSALLA